MIKSTYFSFQFLGELSLIDADPYLKYLPSVIAGAAFHLALYTVTGQSWVRITVLSHTRLATDILVPDKVRVSCTAEGCLDGLTWKTVQLSTLCNGVLGAKLSYDLDCALEGMLKDFRC